ncbi:MAG: hypothetical protein EXR58_01090 [Chloroflexi bacterium]|nr:hypothetical protein [Chloroflexota bacterium]
MGKFEVAAGFVSGLVATLALWFILLWAVNWVPGELGAWGLNAAFLIGITQLIYVLPLWFWAHHRGQLGFARGLVIAASLIFTLDSLCVGGLSISSGTFFPLS